MTALHKWERLDPDLYRIAVPGGWIYSGGWDAPVYVPDPTAAHVADAKPVADDAPEVTE